jgi:hypothetical protein
VLDTAVLQRNFTLNVEQRIAAIVNGPPAWSVRLRRIEDLESKLAQALEDVGEGERVGSPKPIPMAKRTPGIPGLSACHEPFGT